MEGEKGGGRRQNRRGRDVYRQKRRCFFPEGRLEDGGSCGGLLGLEMAQAGSTILVSSVASWFILFIMLRLRFVITTPYQCINTFEHQIDQNLSI